MLLDIPVEERVRIGKVIEFTRKQKQIKIQVLIQGVCAKQTYYKLQNQPIHESEVYDRLLEKVGLYYVYEKVIQPQVDVLYEFFLHKEWESFYQEIDKILRQFDPKCAQTYITYLVLKMLKEGMNRKDSLLVLPFLTEELKEIVSYFILDDIFREGPQCIDKSKLQMNTVMTKYLYLSILLRDELYYDAIVLCEELLRNTQGEYIDKVLITKLFLIRAIQPKDFQAYCEELKKKIDKKNKKLFHLFAYTVGLNYYCEGNYEKAWEYISFACEENQYKVPGLLFLYHMETITEHKLKDSQIKQMLQMDMEDEYKLFFKYYDLKYQKYDLQILEDYLWEYCRKVIECSYPKFIMYQIVRDELYWIASQTGNKKRYYQLSI